MDVKFVLFVICDFEFLNAEMCGVWLEERSTLAPICENVLANIHCGFLFKKEKRSD